MDYMPSPDTIAGIPQAVDLAVNHVQNGQVLAENVNKEGEGVDNSSKSKQVLPNTELSKPPSAGETTDMKQECEKQDEEPSSMHDMLNPLYEASVNEHFDRENVTVNPIFSRTEINPGSDGALNVHAESNGNINQSDNSTSNSISKGVILGPPPNFNAAFSQSICGDSQGNPMTEFENLKNSMLRLSKKDRRVRFPGNEEIVTGYSSPPNPWENASQRTTEELVTAYLTSCDRHGIRPIPRLLSQLKAINDFCDRNETFTVKGEKLDTKHCETLEEVLRRVQFRTIDLENTHLDEDGAVALFDMIEYYESGIRINISFNKNLGLRGWQACARMLKRTPCIEILEARCCALTEQMMPMIGRALRLGSHLRSLHLENAILSGRPLMILVTAIKMNNILTELHLADNRLMPSDGIQLGNMIKFNHHLQLLDLRNNHLQDVGASHLCDGLSEQTSETGLITLVLWNNQVTYQSMTSLSRALMSTKRLETINMGHNNITKKKKVPTATLR